MAKNIYVKLNKNADEIFKVVENRLVSMQISRDFKIGLENGETVTINKWIQESNDGGDNNDWSIKEGQKIYDKMSEEEQDKFYDFISELSVII